VRLSLAGRFKRPRKGNGSSIGAGEIVDLEAARKQFRPIVTGLGKDEAGLAGCGVVFVV